MTLTRSIAYHTGMLALAGVLALRAWTHKELSDEEDVQAILWQGPVEKIDKVYFENKVGNVTIEPRKDSQGRYFIGTVVKKEDPKKPKPDAGAPPPPEEESKIGRFISVDGAQQLFESLAPMRAYRALGKVDPARSAEFGFDDIQGTLKVTVAGKEHALIFGGSTPGGGDYYVKDPAGDGYVVPGNILRDLTAADQRLEERRLHAWEAEDAVRVRITHGDAARELVRTTDKKDSWSSPTNPKERDETATNWMTKVEHLRSTSYAESLNPAPTPADQVLHIEFFDAKRSLGYLDLFRQKPKSDKDRPDYVGKSEFSRWYVEVLRSTAEAVDNDTNSILTP